MAKTWQEELKGESYRVGRNLHPGGETLGWGEHYEVKFTNGVIALIDKKNDTMQAVQTPGKRGFRLYVNGQTHWKKWARFLRVRASLGPVERPGLILIAPGVFGSSAKLLPSFPRRKSLEEYFGTIASSGRDRTD